jgi:hypothetical protein
MMKYMRPRNEKHAFRYMGFIIPSLIFSNFVYYDFLLNI